MRLNKFKVASHLICLLLDALALLIGIDILMSLTGPIGYLSALALVCLTQSIAPSTAVGDAVNKWKVLEIFIARFLTHSINLLAIYILCHI